MADEEIRQLRAAGGPSGSQGPSYSELQKELKKAQTLLAAEQKKTADQAHALAESERQVKSLDTKITLATTRKNTAISDLEKKNVEARGLELKIKELTEQLDREKAGRSADAEKIERLNEALTSSQATFKEYQDAEPSRVAALRQSHIRSPEFSEKICERMYSAFDLAITATMTYLKSKGLLPESTNIPAGDQVELLSNIPRDLYDYIE